MSSPFIAPGNIDIGDATSFELYSSDGSQNTTSNGWVTKTGYPYTTSIKEPALYILDYSCNTTNSNKQKAVGTRVQYREGTSGTWITLGGSDIRNGVSVDGEWQLRTGFNDITLTTETVIQFRFQFGQTDDGGTGSIKESSIKISKAADNE